MKIWMMALIMITLLYNTFHNTHRASLCAETHNAARVCAETRSEAGLRARAPSAASLCAEAHGATRVCAGHAMLREYTLSGTGRR